MKRDSTHTDCQSFDRYIRLANHNFAIAMPPRPFLAVYCQFVSACKNIQHEQECVLKIVDEVGTFPIKVSEAFIYPYKNQIYQCLRKLSRYATYRFQGVCAYDGVCASGGGVCVCGGGEIYGAVEGNLKTILHVFLNRFYNLF